MKNAKRFKIKRDICCKLKIIFKILFGNLRENVCCELLIIECLLVRFGKLIFIYVLEIRQKYEIKYLFESSQGKWYQSSQDSE